MLVVIHGTDVFFVLQQNENDKGDSNDSGIVAFQLDRFGTDDDAIDDEWQHRKHVPKPLSGERKEQSRDTENNHKPEFKFIPGGNGIEETNHKEYQHKCLGIDDGECVFPGIVIEEILKFIGVDIEASEYRIPIMSRVEKGNKMQSEIGRRLKKDTA
jgi:hypothetical protein